MQDRKERGSILERATTSFLERKRISQRERESSKNEENIIDRE
jgi:hypothetical protein